MSGPFQLKKPSMATITFADSIQRYVPTPVLHVQGSTVRELFARVFAERAQLRGYLVDDQGALREHLAVFVNGEQIRDPQGLSDPVPEGARIHVIQALSGG